MKARAEVRNWGGFEHALNKLAELEGPPYRMVDSTVVVIHALESRRNIKKSVEEICEVQE